MFTLVIRQYCMGANLYNKLKIKFEKNIYSAGNNNATTSSCLRRLFPAL